MRSLKKYDKLLNIKRTLNGTIEINRQSPFNSQRNHNILEIKNQYLGSFSWVLKHIISMDNQRFDITGKSHAINKAIRNKKEDDRVSRDIANFFESGGDSVII